MNSNRSQPSTSTGPVLGLIGIGLMGKAMTERLLRAGATVIGWDLSSERRAEFAASGGTCAADAVEILTTCERVLLSLPTHEIVQSVLRSADHVHSRAQFIIDTSTGDPQAAIDQAETLSRRGIEYLDATISGSSQQLRDGTAVFLVGATDAAYAACRDIVGWLSSKAFHTGPVGSGARMKLVTNLVLGLNRAALAEGLVFAQLLGLDPRQTLLLLRESMSYSRIMDTKGEKMLSGDFTPQAKLSQHLKDVRLMLDAAQHAAGTLPLTETHRQILETAMRMGLGELDNSAIFKAISDTSYCLPCQLPKTPSPGLSPEDGGEG